MNMRVLLGSAVLGLLSVQPVAAADEAKLTIAVMDFAPSNVPAGDAVIVSGFVRAAVVRSGMFTVVEKNNMDKVMAEQAFQQTGCTTSDCAVKVGRLLNTRKMVIGEFALLGGVRFLTASLVDVETGAIERTARVKGFEVATADEAADKLVSQLTGVAVSPGSEAMGAPARKRPPRSYTRFGLGFVAENVGYTMDMVWRLPHAGTFEKAVPHMGGQGAFTASLRTPVIGDGRVTAGFDLGAGVRPGPSKAAHATYDPFLPTASAGDPGFVFALDFSGVAVVDLVFGLGLKVGAGIDVVRYSVIPVLWSDSQEFHDNQGTLVRDVPAEIRAFPVLTGGIEWFWGRNFAFEAGVKYVVGRARPPEPDNYDITYDAVRYCGGFRIYF